MDISCVNVGALLNAFEFPHPECAFTGAAFPKIMYSLCAVFFNNRVAVSQLHGLDNLQKQDAGNEIKTDLGEDVK